jgi:hypothetical protein
MTRRGNEAGELLGDTSSPSMVEQGLQLMANLNLSIGRMADEVRATRERDAKLAEGVRPIPGIAVPQITTSGGTADYPELLSPRSGYWWDVKTVTAATFTGGTVSLYAGGQSDSTLRFVFTTSGTFAFGTGQLLVPPGQRLIFVASSVTGSVTPSLSVIEVASWALPAYLM